MPPVNMLVMYRPKKGSEKELETLVLKHWPALASVGLVTSEPATIWRATDKRTGEISFFEKFQWRDAEAPGIAHQTPEVMAVWEPMTPILEDMKLTTIEEIGPAHT